MQIIGVVDLVRGSAVHARGAARDLYRPVQRAGHVHINGDAGALAMFYRDVYGLSDLYLADLGAIAGGPVDNAMVAALSQCAVLWVDAGLSTLDTARGLLQAGASQLIVGLETLPDFDALERLCAATPAGSLVFSLDLRDGELVCPQGSPMGRQSIEEVVTRACGAGIGSVIVLDLGRVGRHEGPAMAAVDRVRNAVPGAAVYAGGGIGSLADIERLRAAGVTGVLLASALHDGRLRPDEIHAILKR